MSAIVMRIICSEAFGVVVEFESDQPEHWIRKLKGTVAVGTRKELDGPRRSCIPLPKHCGVPGHDLECVACGVRLYGKSVNEVCPHIKGER